MNFSLLESECWESSDFQDNFLMNYSRKRQKENGQFENKNKKKKKKLSDAMTAKTVPVITNAIAKDKSSVADFNTNSNEKIRSTFDPYLHNKKQYGQFEKKIKRKKKLSNKAETFSFANTKDEISIADFKTNSNEKIRSTLDPYHHKVSKVKSALTKKIRKGAKQLKNSSNLMIEEETQSNIQMKLMKHTNSQATSNKSYKKTETCKPNSIKIEMKYTNKPNNKLNSSAAELEKEYGQFEKKIKKKKKKLLISTKAEMVSVTTSVTAKEEIRFVDLETSNNEKIKSTFDLYHHNKLSKIETPLAKKKKKKSKLLKNSLNFTTEEEISSNVNMKLMKHTQAQAASNKIRGICKSKSIRFETKNIDKSHNKSNKSPTDLKVTKNKHKNPTSEKASITGSCDKLSISNSHEKVLKEKKSRNKKIKSKIMEKHVSESESEEFSISIFNNDEEETADEDDDELKTELQSSKEYKYLMHFIQRENKNDPDQNIENEADIATEKSSLSINVKNKVSLKVENNLHGSSYATNKDMNCSKEKANNSNKSSALKSKAQKALEAARFRLLNETLYTVSGQEASKYFRSNVNDFKDYHDGYRSQVKKWPINPVDIIIKDLYHKNTCLVIADMGCGEAKIASTFPDRKIFSFDLVALNKHVTCCDFSKVDLPNDSMDIVVFCLSLMGTNLKDYLFEAHRILKFGGELKIAEVESRIEDLKQFIWGIENFGFKLKKQNIAHRVFVFLDFDNLRKEVQKATIPSIKLRPCLYKKR